jgi:hypothetical protein
LTKGGAGADQRDQMGQTQAVDPSWQPGRLFSVTGVGNAEEQERRATSTLLSTMMAVREFGRALVARFGGPAGSIETYLEVPFTLDERTAIPDGVIGWPAPVRRQHEFHARCCGGSLGGPAGAGEENPSP